MSNLSFFIFIYLLLKTMLTMLGLPWLGDKPWFEVCFCLAVYNWPLEMVPMAI